MKIYLFLILFLSSSVSFAIPEGQINPDYDEELFAFMERNGERGQFKGAGNVRINYFVLKGEGNKGGLVFLPGQGEPYVKYFELYQDFLRMGYSPIYTIDHRGQGMSERLLKDNLIPSNSFLKKWMPALPHLDLSKLGYVDDFLNYVSDFKIFLKKVVKPENHENLFLAGHSMGSAIALLYLMEGEENQKVFKAATLSAPMIKPSTDSSFLFFLPQEVEFQLTNFVNIGACATILGCLTHPPEMSRFNAYEEFEGNPFTSNKTRWLQTQRMVQQTGLWFNGPTFKWTLEVLRVSDMLQQFKGKISTPLLFFQAEKDVLVINPPQNKFCKGAGNCRVEVMKNSAHEVFMEYDKIRNKALYLLNDHFSTVK